MRQLRKLALLSEYHLHAQDGEIGRVKEVFFDDQYWSVRYFIVHTGNWLRTRDVLIVPSMLGVFDEDKKYVNVDLTREQIANGPSVVCSLPISRHYENDYFGYYGLNPYWLDTPFPRELPELRPLPAAQQPREPDQSHLRSSNAVSGYRIRARDEEIGHVEDFILDDGDWSIRYLEVSTRNWLPGRHVLIAPIWIHAIDWREQEVIVNLQRQAIASAPAYDKTKVIGKDYETSLYKHYGTSFDSD